MQQEGFTGANNSGFHLVYNYDTRLFAQSPPFYPEYQLSGMGETENSAAHIIEVQENPFSGSLAVIAIGEASLQVFDQSGRLVDRSLSSSPPGIYLVRATAPAGCTETVRVVKIR